MGVVVRQSVDQLDSFDSIKDPSDRIRLLRIKGDAIRRALDHDLDRALGYLDEIKLSEAWKFTDAADSWEALLHWWDLTPEGVELFRAGRDALRGEGVAGPITKKEALKATGRATAAGPTGKHGMNQHTRGDDNVMSSEQGNDPTYACRRLLRDRPDLFERVDAGELSPHAAAIEAGFRKRTDNLPRDPVKWAAKAFKVFSKEERAQLKKLL